MHRLSCMPLFACVLLLLCLVSLAGGCTRTANPHVLSLETMPAAEAGSLAGATWQRPELANQRAQALVDGWLRRQLETYRAQRSACPKRATPTFSAVISDRASCGPFLSLRYSVCVFLGGAHPEVTMETFVLDMRDGRRIGLAELWSDQDKGFATLARETGRALKLADHAVPPAADAFPFFALEPDGLRVFFPLYRFGPRSDGERTALVPYTALRHVLAPYWLENLNVN